MLKNTLALVAILALSACETVSATQAGNGTYHLSSSVEAVSWRPGLQGANDQLNGMAKQKCPSGWEVLNQKSETIQGKQYLSWTIRCEK